MQKVALEMLARTETQENKVQLVNVVIPVSEEKRGTRVKLHLMYWHFLEVRKVIYIVSLGYNLHPPCVVNALI